MASKLLRLARTLPKAKQIIGSRALVSKRHASTQERMPEWSQSVRNVPKAELSELDNGFRIACEDSGGPTCTVGLFINAGSRYESPETNGVAHFLEHMIFKGTQKRSMSDLQLEVENMGAHLNAYTSREHTVYYAKCLSKDLEKAVDILADITQNSKLEKKYIEEERNVILREMQEVGANQQEVVFDYLHATAFQDTSLGNTILGPTENVMSIGEKDLRKYITDHYSGDRMVLAASGGVDSTKLKELGEKYFGNLRSGPRNPLNNTYPTRYTGSELKHREDSLPYAHVAIAVEGAPWMSLDNPALMVASTAIGSWDRSHGGGINLLNDLAKKCAEKYTCHSYMAFNTCYSDTGLWGVYFVTDKAYVEDMTFCVQQEWMRQCTQTLDYELLSAKRKLMTNMLLQLDNTTSACEEIGRQVLCYDRFIPISEMFHYIGNLSSSDIRDTCFEYIYDKCPVIAGLGPIEGLYDYNRIRSQMYWLRL